MKVQPSTLLRAVLVALLAFALVAGADARHDRNGTFVSPPPAAQNDWLARLARADGALIVRATEQPPSPAELAKLDAGAALGHSVLAGLPEAPPPLIAFAPLHARVERAAALPFLLTGVPGEDRHVLLADAAGVLDSAAITLDSAGTAAAAFRIRPAREGWQEWTVHAGRDSVRVGAWVRPAAPPRVLVAAGAPTWEARFLARALEESGATATLAQPLGRALTLGDAPAGLPASAAAIAGYDVIIVTADANVDAARALALRRYAAEGGGVIIAGNAAAIASLGIATPAAIRTLAPADSAVFIWNAPPEVSPLPRAAVTAALLPLRDPGPGTITAATAGNAAVLVLASAGAGRIAAVGIDETWRWRMEAGLGVAHRSFWRSLVDWAAMGADSMRAFADRRLVAPGDVVHAGVTGPAPAALTLRRPGGTREPLLVRTEPDGAAVRFVAADTGVHLLLADERVLAAIRADPDAPAAAHAWPAVAALAQAAGGAAVPRDSLDAAESAWRSARNGGRRPSASWLFVALVAIACAEWALRRTRGLA